MKRSNFPNRKAIRQDEAAERQLVWDNLSPAKRRQRIEERTGSKQLDSTNEAIKGKI